MDHTMKPMLATAADVVPEGAGWVAEPKLDGWRLVIERTQDGVRVFGGRNSSDYTGKLPYLEAAIAAGLPPGTVLDGEIMGLNRGHVQSVFFSNVPHAPSAHDPELTFWAFDILRVAGDDVRLLSWEQRRALLLTAVQGMDPHVQHTPTFDSNEESLTAALAAGFEGLVCKRTDSRYANSRSTSWVKLKPQQTVEARVTGFKPGKKGGRWDGKVGAFEVEILDDNDQPTGATTTVKCGTDERHIEATEHPERWLGVVIELLHHGMQASGVPLHPQFHHRRDDKTTAPARPKRTVPNREVTRVAGGPSGRNYGAMKDAKLLTVIGQLKAGKGEAVDRVLAKNASVEADLAIAEGIAQQRGLEVTV